MPNQTVKNGLKRSNYPKCFKKILRDNPKLQGCAIFRSKMGHLSWTNFFGTNHDYYFYLPIDHSHCAKFNKKFLQQIQSYENVPFLSPKWSICPPPPSPPKIFWKKSLISFLSTYWLLSLYKILKNSNNRSRVMRMCHFWALNGLFAQMRILSDNLLIKLNSIIHAYLHAKNQSQILTY